MFNMKKTCVTFLSAAFGAVAVSGQTCKEVDVNGAAIFPAGTTAIARKVFMNCDKLKSVEIPNTVETVGEDTFYGAVNLASVTFAAGSVVTKLDYGAFGYCSSLKSVEIPASVEIIFYYAFTSAVNLASVTFAAGSKVKSFGKGAFSYTKIKNIVIPQGVTSFDGDSVFGNTPCNDKAVFKPGNTVVNCKIIAPTPSPTTMVPTTAAPTTAAPTCANLKKKKCKNNCIFSKRQRQCLPKSTSLEHDCSQYEGKTPCLEVKVCKFPHGKCVHRCDGKNARRCRKHKFCNLDKVVNPCFGCHLVTACGPRR